MNILFDIGHPASIHLFRNFAKIMEGKGHNVLFLIREKDITLDLAKAYNLNYVSFGTPFKGTISKIIGGVSFFVKLFRETKRFKADIIINSTTVYPALIGKITRIPVISFHNTDIDPMLKFVKLFNPIFVTPASFKTDLGKKHIKYKGYNELAFLHRNYFKPRFIKIKDIREGEKIILLRFVSWTASDDIGSNGLSLQQKRTLIEEFSKYGKVLISAEGNVEEKYDYMHIEKQSLIPVGQMQSLIAKSVLLFGESGAMASEAAMIGVPAFYFSTKRLGFLDELEHKYELLFNTNDFDSALSHALNLLKNLESTHELWENRVSLLLKENIDLTKLMAWLVEFYPLSVEKALSINTIKTIPNNDNQ